MYTKSIHMKMSTLTRKRRHSGSVPGDVRLSKRKCFLENIPGPCNLGQNVEGAFQQMIREKAQCVMNKPVQCEPSDATTATISCKPSKSCSELVKSTQRKQNNVQSIIKDALFVSQLLEKVMNNNGNPVTHDTDYLQSCSTTMISDTATPVGIDTNTYDNETVLSPLNTCTDDCTKTLPSGIRKQSVKNILEEDIVDKCSSKVCNMKKTNGVSDLTLSRRKRQSFDIVSRHDQLQNLSNKTCIAQKQRLERNCLRDSASEISTVKIGKASDIVIKCNENEKDPNYDENGAKVKKSPAKHLQSIRRKHDLQPSCRRSSINDQLSNQTCSFLSQRKSCEKSNASQNIRHSDHNVIESNEVSKFGFSKRNRYSATEKERLSRSFDEGNINSGKLGNKENVRRRRLGPLRTSINSSTSNLESVYVETSKKKSTDSTHATKTISTSKNQTVTNRVYMSSPALLIGSNNDSELENITNGSSHPGLDRDVETTVVPDSEQGQRQNIIQKIHQRIAKVEDKSSNGLHTKLQCKAMGAGVMDVEQVEEMIPLQKTVKTWKRNSSSNGQFHILHHHSSGTVWNNVVSKFLSR